VTVAVNTTGVVQAKVRYLYLQRYTSNRYRSLFSKNMPEGLWEVQHRELISQLHANVHKACYFVQRRL
jgi:transposase-like protein